VRRSCANRASNAAMPLIVGLEVPMLPILAVIKNRGARSGRPV
jgi:hypothetical protein